MSFCSNCGAPLEAGNIFCTKCGAPVQGQNANQGYNANQYGNQYGDQQFYRTQPYPGQVRPVSFGQKNIAVAIILSIVTLGIYSIIWLINMVDQLNEASDTPNATPGTTVFLLSLVTCGIYSLFWIYKAGEQVNRAKAIRYLPADSNSGVIYLVLSLFGFGIVAYALIQSELNKIAEYHGAPKA